MKKYDLILFTGGAGAYAPKRVEEEAKKKGLRVLLAEYRDLHSKISDRGFKTYLSGKELPQAKGVFLRALGEDTVYNALKINILHAYDDMRVKVLNSRSFLIWPSLDKTIQSLELRRANIPIVESFFFGSKARMLEWAQNEKMPLIVKQNVGSLGTEVFKVNSVSELKRLLTNYNVFTVKTLLVQRFLEGGEDLRVIVLGGKVIGAMKRIAQKGTHLTNYSQGGRVESYAIENDPKAVEIALKVAKTFHLDYCGVDLMKDPGDGWKVLEVNRACQFQGFEQSTGINVAKKVVDFLTK